MKSDTVHDTNGSRWICCQIGAREHYAVPRALTSAGSDVHLLTDVWAAPESSWWMPNRWRQRWHADIPQHAVTAWNFPAARLQCQLAARRLSMWDRIRATDNWFQRKCARKLSSLVDNCCEVPTVFAYSYGARAVFEVAKRLGCRTVLGQIDPGPVEMRLVQQLEAEYGFADLQWPLHDYWDSWKAECSLADDIVVNSEWSRSALLSEGVEREKIRIIPLAYERDESKMPLASGVPVQFTSARPLRVLFLGQVNLRKGIKELGNAIRQLRGCPVEWTIVGGGDARLTGELQSLPRTIVTGAVSRREVGAYYRSADVFILPTHSDGFALTQLEAAAYGLPIIASEFCGDVVANGVNGIRLSEVSGAAIAEAVNSLARNPAQLRMLAQNQREMPFLSTGDLGRQFTALARAPQRRAA